MKNIQILNVRPNRNSEGAYVAYSAVLRPTDHTINGNFTATDAETKTAFGGDQSWDGFKSLALKRVKSDVSAFAAANN